MAKQTKAAETPAQPEQQPEQTTEATSFVKPAPQQPIVQEHVFEGKRVMPSDATTAETVEDEQTQQPQTQQNMTQADIDKIIAARLKQERQKFADYDQLKQKVQAFEDAQKTEAEKTTERLQALESENQKLARERKEIATRAAIVAEAGKLGLDPDAAFKLADLTSLDDDFSNAADVVKAVASQYPGLMRNPVPSVAATNPPRTQQPAGRTDDQRRQEYFSGGGGSFWRGTGVRFQDE